MHMCQFCAPALGEQMNIKNILNMTLFAGFDLNRQYSILFDI